MTDSEKRAVIILASVILVSVLIQWLLPLKSQPDIYDYTLEDSMFTIISKGASSRINPEISDTMEKTQKNNRNKSIKKTDLLRKKSIDINKASYEQLTRLPRIGKVTATEILKYREKNGPFKTLQDLTKVKRIGPKTLEKISPYIYIQADTSTN